MLPLNCHYMRKFNGIFINKTSNLLFERLSGNEEVCNKVMSNLELKKRVVKRLAKQIYERVKC